MNRPWLLGLLGTLLVLYAMPASALSVRSADIVDGQVMTVDLANGAVTNAKITGPIAASKISSAGLEADTVDGMHAIDLAPAIHVHSQSDVSGLPTALAGKAAAVHGHSMGDIVGLDAAFELKADAAHDHDAVYQKKYANVVVVAKSGADYTDPIAALDSITDASGSNPYLVKILPGVYDLGTRTLFMKQFVDIEGSGETTTILAGSLSSDDFHAGSVSGASDAELRLLTVANTGTGNFGTAIVNNGSSPRLSQVTATSLGASTYCTAIYNIASSPVMTHVTAAASGGMNNTGVMNYGSSPTMRHVTATASGGQNSIAVANAYADSPFMANVTATASGGTSGNFGLDNMYSHPVMSDVTASASGTATLNVGVRAQVSSLSMTRVAASSSGGDQPWAIMLNSSPGVLTDVIAIGSYGLYATGTSSVTIDRSTIEGYVGSIVSGPGQSVRVGSSKLVGGVTGAGTFACVASYDDSYAPLNAICSTP